MGPTVLRAKQNPPCPGIFIRDRQLFIRGWEKMPDGRKLGTVGSMVDVSNNQVHVIISPVFEDGTQVFIDDPLGTGMKMEITRQCYVPRSSIDTVLVDMTRSASASFMNLTSLTSMKYDGGPGDEFVLGGGGNDTISTGGGNDTIGGGPGNDSINTGSGTNVVLSGLGADTVSAAPSDIIVDPSAEDTITRRTSE